jgi:hypothetical protein
MYVCKLSGPHDINFFSEAFKTERVEYVTSILNVAMADDYFRTDQNKLTRPLLVIMGRGRVKGQMRENCEDPPPSSYGQYKAQRHRLDVNPDPVGRDQTLCSWGRRSGWMSRNQNLPSKGE